MSLYTAFERNMAMNKVVIPAILGAVVLVAGMFAMMPVQQAQTVHTFLGGEIQDLGDVLCIEFGHDGYDPTVPECFDIED
jgi:hypothetical protein